jgi:large subunit ribosomal protein L10
MSEQNIALKAQQVDEVAQLLKDSASAIVVDSRGLTVAQVNDLRNQLRAEGVSLKVIKNKIMTRAAEKAGFEELNPVFVGPSAVAFSESDAIAPARILKKFSDTADALELKGGIVDGKVVSLDEVNRYAALPSREALLGQLMAEFQFPLRSFMYAVKAVAEKREADGEVAEAPAVEAAPAEATEEATAEDAVAEEPKEEVAEAVEAPAAENNEESAE